MRTLLITDGRLEMQPGKSTHLATLRVSHDAAPLHILSEHICEARVLAGDETILLNGTLNVGDFSLSSHECRSSSIWYGNEALRIDIKPSGVLRVSTQLESAIITATA